MHTFAQTYLHTHNWSVKTRKGASVWVFGLPLLKCWSNNGPFTHVWISGTELLKPRDGLLLFHCLWVLLDYDSANHFYCSASRISLAKAKTPQHHNSKKRVLNEVAYLFYPYAVCTVGNRIKPACLSRWPLQSVYFLSSQSRKRGFDTAPRSFRQWQKQLGTMEHTRTSRTKRCFSLSSLSVLQRNM